MFEVELTERQTNTMNSVAVLKWTKRLRPIIHTNNLTCYNGRMFVQNHALHQRITAHGPFPLLVRRWRCFSSVGSSVSVKRLYADFQGRTDASSEFSTGDLDVNEVDYWTKSTGPDPVFSIDILVALLRQENAADVCVIKVPQTMKYADYFVVVSCSSTRHLRAMAHYAIKVYKHIKGDDNPHVRIEGKDSDDWSCIDFGDIVVHFMLPECRELYELEKLWTLRSYDEQLASIPPESLPDDFIYSAEVSSDGVK